MERTMNASNENKTLVAFDGNAVDLAMFDKDPHKAVKDMANQLADVKGIESAITCVKSSEWVGKVAWVRTAIVVYNVFNNLPRKETKEYTTRMQEALGFKSPVSIHNYRKAGERLMSDDFEEIPTAMSDFIAKPKKSTAYDAVEIAKAIGFYEINDHVYIIYKGFKIESAKKKPAFLATTFDFSGTLPENGYVYDFEENARPLIKVNHLVKVDSGNPYDTYEYKNIPIDVQFLPLG